MKDLQVFRILNVNWVTVGQDNPRHHSEVASTHLLCHPGERRDRKRPKPNRATWFMLATISVVIAVTYKDGRAESTLFAAIGAAVGTVAIAILSIWNGTGEWSKLDSICILISGASLLIYFFSASPLLTLILFLIMDGAALVPTIQHARKTPHEEDRLAWTLTVLGDFLAVVAIDQWTFGVALYPIYMVAINGSVLFYLYRPRLIRQNVPQY